MSNFLQTELTKMREIMVFEILTFDFYLEEKRRLKTTVYMNASTSQCKNALPNIVRCQ